MAADWQKASIGNYKGVMLCNRPNEFGQQRKADLQGNLPFNSRVNPAVPVGWNPTAKLLPKANRKKINPNNVLLKHRKFLRTLEQKKNEEREEAIRAAYEEEFKVQQFREQAEVKRAKVREIKSIQEDLEHQ